MKKALLFIMTGWMVLSCFAQEKETFDLDRLLVNTDKLKPTHFNNHLTYQDVKGSPYLQDSFICGRILLPDGNSYNNIPLRYNIYTDNMEFENKDGQAMELLEPGRYELFVIGNDSIKYLPYISGNKTGQGYFQLLSAGHIRLLKRYSISYRPKEPEKPFQDSKPPEFVRMKPELYLSTGDKPAEKVGSHQQTLLLLKSEKNDIAEWVKQNHLKLNKEEDLLKAVQYSNQ